MKELSDDLKEILIDVLYKNRGNDEKPFSIIEKDNKFIMNFKKIRKNYNKKYGAEIHTSHTYNKNDIIKILYKDVKSIEEKGNK